jgi:hypothetical protein
MIFLAIGILSHSLCRLNPPSILLWNIIDVHIWYLLHDTAKRTYRYSRSDTQTYENPNDVTRSQELSLLAMPTIHLSEEQNDRQMINRHYFQWRPPLAREAHPVDDELTFSLLIKGCNKVPCIFRAYHISFATILIWVSGLVFTVYDPDALIRRCTWLALADLLCLLMNKMFGKTLRL